MFFTQDDYKKIYDWIKNHSIKDSEFSNSKLLDGREIITVVQQGHNVKLVLQDFLEQLTLLNIPDFVNVTERYDLRYISLIEAIKSIPQKARKTGQVITFLDDENHWKIYQFKGEVVSQWDVISLWVDILRELIDIGSIIPDEEDLTTIKQGNNTVVKFKNKVYNPNNFSGKGRIYLRKNIATVEDPNTDNIYTTNLLTQQMLSEEDTIYIIQYDYNLNGQTITVPKGCILQFEGGKFYNGYISGSLLNEVLYLENFDIEDIGVFFSKYKPIDGQKIVLENKTYITSIPIVINSKSINIDGNNSIINSNINKSDNTKAEISLSTGIRYTFTNLTLSSNSNYNFELILNPEIIENIEEGDIIKLRTNNAYLKYYPESIYSIVRGVDRENNIVHINDSYQYNTIYEINIIKPCKLNLCNFTYVNKGAYNIAINCNGAINSSFENITLIGNGALTGLQVSGINNNIRKCNIKEFFDTDKIGVTGYGINISGNNNVVEQNIINNCRHCITSAERSYLSRGIIIRNNNVSANSPTSNFYNACIDVHGCCEAIISDNIINVARGIAFQIRSNNTVFNNNTINVINGLNSHMVIGQLAELLANCTISNNTINAPNTAYVCFIYITSVIPDTKNISICNNTFNNVYFRIGNLSDCNISITQNIMSCGRYSIIDVQNDLSSKVLVSICNNYISNNNKALITGRTINKLNSVYIQNNIFTLPIKILDDDFVEEVSSLLIIGNTFKSSYTLPVKNDYIFYNNNTGNSIINKVGSNQTISGLPKGDYYLDTRYNKPYFKTESGTYVDAEGLDYGIPHKGTSENRPTTAQNVDAGFLYYDTDLYKLVIKKFQSQSYYVDALGSSADVKYKGVFAERPIVNSTHYLQENFMYFCTDLASPETGCTGIPIFYKEKTETSNAKWVDCMGREVTTIYPRPYNHSGTFANKPSSAPIGFSYFCTNKQTSEGSSNGIMIFYKGEDIWVDALGRTVS